MSVHTRKHLTKDNIEILVDGQKVELPLAKMRSLATVIDSMIGDDVVPAKEVHGKWLDDARLRAANYLKGTRKREALTQEEVCKKIEGLAQSNLSAMESGSRPIPKDLIQKFCKLYNIKAKMITESLVLKSLEKRA